MSITRDRELADLLYNSIHHMVQLQSDLNSLQGLITTPSTDVVEAEPKNIGATAHQHHAEDHRTSSEKAIAALLKKSALLQNQQEHLIKLLIQNHTDASSILNEFEKIRTAKLLSSETFALAHLIPTVQK